MDVFQWWPSSLECTPRMSHYLPTSLSFWRQRSSLYLLRLFTFLPYILFFLRVSVLTYFKHVTLLFYSSDWSRLWNMLKKWMNEWMNAISLQSTSSIHFKDALLQMEVFSNEAFVSTHILGLIPNMKENSGKHTSLTLFCVISVGPNQNILLVLHILTLFLCLFITTWSNLSGWVSTTSCWYYIPSSHVPLLHFCSSTVRPQSELFFKTIQRSCFALLNLTHPDHVAYTTTMLIFSMYLVRKYF